jgi:hypothetical protein
LMMRQRSHMVLTDGRTFISGNQLQKAKDLHAQQSRRGQSA